MELQIPDTYVPEAVLKALVPGQRVRYVPRGECAVLSIIGSYAAEHFSANVHESQTGAENQAGTIIDTDYYQAGFKLPGHPYAVRMDKGYEFGGFIFHIIAVAAYELVLIEDE